MVNAFHGRQSIEQGIHGIISFEYADEAARLAAGPFQDYDLNKLAYELDTDRIYILTDPTGPTWQLFITVGLSSSTLSGPNSSTDNAIVRWDGTDGYIIKNSSITIDDLGYINGVTSLNFDIITSSIPPHSEGRIFYDGNEHTLSLYNDEADVTHQLGQESLIRVYNNTGSTITNGSVVYASGTEMVEYRPSIDLALADSLSTSSILGVVTHDIETGTFGYVTRFGLVNNVDTSAFSPSDVVYLSNTVPGGLDTAPPDGSGLFTVRVGIVIRSDASLGKILITTSSDSVAVGDASELVISCEKDSAGTINAGSVVYLVGYDVGSDRPTVELADASSGLTMPAIGIARDTITNTSAGNVVSSGRFINLDTSSFSEGDELFVSEIPGGLTNVRPGGTALIQKIATVLRSHPSFGVIELLGPGISNNLPNLAQNNIWVGDVNGLPQETLHVGEGGSAHALATSSTAGFLSSDGYIKIESFGNEGNYILVDGTRAFTGNIDVGSNSITNVNLVDGVDVSAHATRHESGGADAIDGYNVDLAYTPTNYTDPVNDLIGEHIAAIDEALANTGAVNSVFGRIGDVIAVSGDYDSDEIDNVSTVSGASVSDALEQLQSQIVGGGGGTVTGQETTTDNAIVRWNGTDGYTIQNSGIIIDDSDNVTGITTLNGVTIESHASRHENGGADEINVGGLSGLLVDPQTPLTHAGTHISGGSDQIDGDQIDITWNPSNYTPSTSPVEATSIDHLTAHLFGIDQVLGIVVTDHGNLTGLGDDDHTQYLLVDGTRSMSGNLDAGTNNIINVGTVDGVDVSSHVSRHESGGADAIEISNLGTSETNTDLVLKPNGVGGVSWTQDDTNSLDGYVFEDRQIIAGAGLTGGGDLSTDRTLNVIANADGSIVVNADDIQIGVLATDVQHGNRGGGSIHADATTTVSGFMSGTDKTKLDSIDDGAQVNTVDSVFGRTGDVIALASDYDASQIDNDSSVQGVFVSDALDYLDGQISLIDLDGYALETDLQTHITDTANPHSTDIGNLGSGTLAELNSIITDATLDDSSDSRIPTPHAATHENDGSDEINVGGLSGVLADPQTPLTHAGTHISGESDEIDGDQIDIDWNPSNYTPTITPVEVNSIDHLTAHLAGIDTVLATIGGGGFTPPTDPDQDGYAAIASGGDLIYVQNIYYDEVDGYVDIENIRTVTFFEYDNGNSGSSITIDFNLGQKQSVTLTDDGYFSFDFPGVGNYMLKIIQDGTGGYSIIPPDETRAAGQSIDLASTADAVTIWAIYYDGKNAFISSMPDTGDTAPTVNLV